MRLTHQFWLRSFTNTEAVTVKDLEKKLDNGQGGIGIIFLLALIITPILSRIFSEALTPTSNKYKYKNFLKRFACIFIIFHQKTF